MITKGKKSSTNDNSLAQDEQTSTQTLEIKIKKKINQLDVTDEVQWTF